MRVNTMNILIIETPFNYYKCSKNKIKLC